MFEFLVLSGLLLFASFALACGFLVLREADSEKDWLKSIGFLVGWFVLFSGLIMTGITLFIATQPDILSSSESIPAYAQNNKQKTSENARKKVLNSPVKKGCRIEDVIRTPLS